MKKDGNEIKVAYCFSSKNSIHVPSALAALQHFALKYKTERNENKEPSKKGKPTHAPPLLLAHAHVQSTNQHNKNISTTKLPFPGFVRQDASLVPTIFHDNICLACHILACSVLCSILFLCASSALVHCGCSVPSCLPRIITSFTVHLLLSLSLSPPLPQPWLFVSIFVQWSPSRAIAHPYPCCHCCCFPVIAFIIMRHRLHNPLSFSHTPIHKTHTLDRDRFPSSCSPSTFLAYPKPQRGEVLCS